MPAAQYWPEASAILTTFFLSLAMQSHWTPQSRRLIALGFSIAVAAVGLYVEGGVDTNDVLTTLFTVVIGAQGVYELLNKRLDALSTKTDVTPTPPNPGLGGVKIIQTNGAKIVPAGKPGQQ